MTLLMLFLVIRVVVLFYSETVQCACVEVGSQGPLLNISVVVKWGMLFRLSYANVVMLIFEFSLTDEAVIEGEEGLKSLATPLQPPWMH